LAKRLALPLLAAALACALWILFRERTGAGAADFAGASETGTEPPVADGGEIPGRTEIATNSGAEDARNAATDAPELGIPSFTGRILTPDGMPASGALVHAEGLTGWADALDAADRARRLGAEWRTLAAADGRFALPEAPRDGLYFTLRIERPGAAPRRLVNQPAVPGRTHDLGDLALENAADLRGRVVDSGGNAAPGAEVVVAREPADAPFARARAEDSGRFTLEDLPHGTLWLRAEADGALSRWSEHRLGDPASASREIVLRIPAAVLLRGSVLDPARNGLGGAKVVAEIPALFAPPNDLRTLRARTQAEGRFVLAVPADAEQVQVRVAAAGHAVALRTLRRADFKTGPHEFVLQPLPPLAGIVVDAQGRPVADAAVGLFLPETHPPPPSERRALAAACVAPDGSFRLAWDPGLAQEMQIVAWSPQYAPSMPLTLDPSAGATDPAHFPLRLELAPGVRLAGRVVGPDGVPADGARVVLRRLQAGRGWMRIGFDTPTRGGPVHARATTDARGEFGFTGLAPGDYRAEALVPGLAPGESADLALVEPLLDLEIALGAPCGILGSVEGSLADFADLQVIAGARDRDPLAAWVDARGGFRFDNLAPDEWTLTVAPAPYSAAADRFAFAGGRPLARLEGVPVAAGQFVPVVLRLDLADFGRLDGSVRLARGPAAGFNVFLFPNESAADSDPRLAARHRAARLRSTATDQNGRFAFAGLEAREWIAVVCLPGGSPNGLDRVEFEPRGLARRRIAIGAGDAATCDLELLFGTLSVAVSGAGATGADFEARIEPEPGSDAGAPFIALLTADAAERLSLPSGPWRVCVGSEVYPVLVEADGTSTVHVAPPGSAEIHR